MALNIGFSMGGWPGLEMPDFSTLPYKGPMKRQELIGKELENAINKVKAEFERENQLTTIAKRKADTAHAGALTKSETLRHPYITSREEAEIAKAQADAYINAMKGQKLEAIIPILRQSLQGNQPGQNVTHGLQPNMANAQEQMTPANIDLNQTQTPGGLPNMVNSPLQQQIGQLVEDTMQPPGLFAPQQSQEQLSQDYLRNQILAHELGLPSHPGHVVNGMYTYQDPFTGRIQQIKVGPSDAEKVMNEHEAKYAAEADEGARNAIEAAYAREPAFDELLSIINNPEFYKTSGPISERIRKLTNNKEVNELAGRLNYLLGDIVNKASRQFGARLNKAEYTALQRMKGSTTDNPYELRSKILLMDALRRYELQVNQEYLKNRQNGYNRDTALQQAYEKADYSKIKNIVNIDSAAHGIAQKYKTDYSKVMSAAERAAKDFNIPIEQALRDME